VNGLGRVVSSLHKGWAISGEVTESRCVPIGRRHFLQLHLLANYVPNIDLGLEDIHVSASTKDVVFSLEQPRLSDNRSFIIRFLVSRIGSFTLSVLVKNQHISGSPFQVSGVLKFNTSIPYCNKSGKLKFLLCTLCSFTRMTLKTVLLVQVPTIT